MGTVSIMIHRSTLLYVVAGVPNGIFNRLGIG